MLIFTLLHQCMYAVTGLSSRWLVDTKPMQASPFKKQQVINVQAIKTLFAQTSCAV
jgi:hypothetical protein